jgi:hypothetical protein
VHGFTFPRITLTDGVGVLFRAELSMRPATDIKNR